MPDEIRTANEGVTVTMPPPEVFSQPVIVCPSCNHGIDPHGIDPGGWCGVGDEQAVPCQCLWSPNDIAAVLMGQAAFSERQRLRDVAASATIIRQEDGLAALKIDDPNALYWTPVSTHLIEALVEERNADTERIQRDERERCMRLLEEARDRYVHMSEGVVNGNSSGAVFYTDAIRVIREA